MAEIKDILVPDIGDFDGVEVIEILVAAGDQIAVEDPIASLESDKAAMEIPSPLAGTVKDVKISIGDKVSEGSLLITLELSDNAPSEEAAPEAVTASEPAKTEAPAKPASKPATAPATPRPAPTAPLSIN
jgi:pyruvate dehydrogenase E2 component (dihydrolipoamide acetyltransferase)